MEIIDERPQKEAPQSKSNSSKLISRLKQQITLSKALLVLFLIIAITLLGVLQPSAQQRALDFTLEDIHEQKNVTLSDYQGNVVLLEFMATWCPSCRKETPEVYKINQSYESQVVIITIGVDPRYDTIQRLTTYVTDHDMSWMVVRDTKEVVKKYGVEAIPILVLIDRNQNIRWRNTGWVSSITLSEEINRIL